MKVFFTILWGFVVMGFTFAVVGWVFWRLLKRSDDPAKALFYWILTGLILFGLAATAVGVGQSPILPGVAAVFGIVLAIIWAPRLGSGVASLFTGLYDGGSQSADPTPLYSTAEARRKRGKPDEALAEVRAQLAKFPNDFQGWMLLAEIQAEDQRNVTGAVETIDQLLAQKGHAPKNIAFALNRCADWELKIRNAPEAARRAFERIIELLPDTEQAQFALQRLAHVPSASARREQQDRSPIAVPHFDPRLGLRPSPAVESEPPPNDDVAKIAAEYVRRLQEIPEDNEARELLAVLYAEHYQRLNLAEQELEQLIAAPNQPPKQVVHWLNLMADLQVKHGGDMERARQTLRRIPELFPKSAFSEIALNRIGHLNLEARGNQKSQSVKLGAYEKNLGLK